MNGLGALFESLRASAGLLRNLFFVILVVLLGLNVVIRPDEVGFELEGYPGFFAGFGLIVGVVALLVLEKIIRPLIARKEDFYGDI